MISNVKFNELANRVDLLVEKILHLEAQVKSLTDSQGGEIPPGMTPVATLAAEYGKLKSGGFVAPDEKFREAARLVLRSAKRKYGSAYWFHPLIGKFQMSGGIPK